MYSNVTDTGNFESIVFDPHATDVYKEAVDATDGTWMEGF
jgi:hypothetical protein